MFFTLFPPITIEGSIEKKPVITGLETLQKISINAEKVSVDLNIEGSIQKYDIILFNNNFTDVHKRIDPDDNFPLELMPLITIEFFEEIAKFLGGYTLIYIEPPKTGFFEFYRGDRYPISVRGSGKQLYATTAELRPLRKDYIIALQGLLSIDFEEQLENSLATFVENILKPMSETMTDVLSSDEALENEESIVDIIGGDFKRLISRTQELISIVNYNMEQTAERHKAFLRLTLPLMLKQALLENFSDYLEFKFDPNCIKLNVIKRKTIQAKDLMDIIIQTLK